MCIGNRSADGTDLSPLTTHLIPREIIMNDKEPEDSSAPWGYDTLKHEVIKELTVLKKQIYNKDED